MPFYQVFHTHPLTTDQRQSMAKAITDLHSTAFNMPAFFVHVSFVKQQAAPVDASYFMAGKPHSHNANRVVGMVRTSSTRTKQDFDELATRIESAWDQVVGGDEMMSGGMMVDEEKRLMMVAFTPVLSIRESGMTGPVPGNEDAWLKEQLPYIKEMQSRGMKDFTMLLEELEKKEGFSGCSV